VEPTPRRIRVVFAGETIADTTRAWRVLETSHPPTYYIPPDDVLDGVLFPSSRSSWCEWKGRARYHAVRVGGRTAESAAWSYPDPVPAFEPIRDHVAFYPAKMDRCLVDEEEARPQPGGFYGGWVTSDLDGPFKGEPGSEGW